MKKPTSTPIATTQKELNDLKVKRSIENTDKYDKQIKELEDSIDWYNFGIKC